MAVRTSSSTARNTSYSKPSTPKKTTLASSPTSSSKPNVPTQTKQAVSVPKRDTFTYSSQTAKQTAAKTSTTKTSTASKTTQTKTSTTKTNTASKTSSTKSTTKSKSASTANSKNRDTFTYTSQKYGINNKKINKCNSYNGYGPFKLDISKNENKTYYIPYCENKVNITNGNVTILKPDSKSQYGYVEYKGEKYSIQYNELEEGKQAFFGVYTEVKHLQLPGSGLKFDVLSGFSNTSLEEVPSRSFKDKSGNILQSNSKNPKNDGVFLDNHSNSNILANMGLNALGFVQKGLRRDNMDVILMENDSVDKIASVTYSQNYLGVKNDGILGHCTTPTKLLAVDKNGNLYDINDSSSRKKKVFYVKK